MSISIKCGSMIQVINTGVANVVAVSKNGWLKVCYDTQPGLVFSVRNSPKTVKLILEATKTVELLLEEPNYLSGLPDDVIQRIYYWKEVYETFDAMYDSSVIMIVRLETILHAKREANIVARNEFCSKLSGRKYNAVDLNLLIRNVELDGFISKFRQVSNQGLDEFTAAKKVHHQAIDKAVPI